MTTYYPHKITLSDGQKVRLAQAFGPGEAVSLRFKNEAIAGGSDTLHLTARYFASEFLREPEYQKKLANKAKPIARKAVNYTIDALSGDLLTKASNRLRPKDMIPGNMVKGGCHTVG